MTPAPARFRDRRAIVVWIFAVLWDSAVVLLGAVVLAEAPHWKGWLALAVFGLGGVGLTAFALDAPMLAVDVRSSGVTVTRRYPLGRRRQLWRLSEVRGATVVEDNDGEGGPYYRCRIELHGADPIDLYGKSRREAVEAEVARFNAAAGTHRTFAPHRSPSPRPSS